MSVLSCIGEMTAALSEISTELGLAGKVWSGEDRDGISYEARVPIVAPPAGEDCDPNGGGERGADDEEHRAEYSAPGAPPEPEDGPEAPPPAVLRAAPTQEKLEAWFDCLGDSLELVVDGSDDLPDTEPLEWRATSASHDGAALDIFLENARRFTEEISVRLSLDKTPLVAALRAEMVAEEAGGTAAGAAIVLFFSGDRLVTILSNSDHRFFEDHFLGVDASPSQNRPLLVLIGDTPGYLQGPHLAFLGRSSHARFADFFSGLRPFDKSATSRGLMRKLTNWDDRPAILSPELLTIDDARARGLEGCRQQIVRLQNQLIVSYLANRTTAGDGGPRATFEGLKSVAVEVGEETSSTALYALYEFAYGDPEAATTNLEIARRAVAAELPSGATFSTLVSLGPELLFESEAQRRVLIDKNLVESFNRRAELEKLVRGYVDEVSAKIGGLVREVVDNAYKTVGLLVGIAIGYALKPEQGPVLVLIGTVLFVAYILFVRHFYLGSLEDDFDSRRKAFAHQSEEIQRLRVVLPESDVLVSQVTDKNCEFKSKYRWVRKLYRSLAIAGGILALTVLLSWAVRNLRPSPAEELRREAVTEQAERLKGLGYSDIRAGVEGHPAPDRLTDEATGRTIVPDVSGTTGGGKLLVLEYVPCSSIGDAEELSMLRLLEALTKRQGAGLELVTEAICDGDTGPAAVRQWLAGGDLAPPPVRSR